MPIRKAIEYNKPNNVKEQRFKPNKKINYQIFRFNIPIKKIEYYKKNQFHSQICNCPV